MFYQRHPYASVLLALAIVSLGPGVSAAAVTPPELPRGYVETTMPTQSGSVITVNAGGDLQAALDVANLGDTIVLQAGATFTGPYVLRNKTSGTGWIVIQSSALGGLPAAGTRVGPSDAANMAKVVGAGYMPAIVTAEAAHHYRLIGLEVTGTSLPAGIANGGLILLDAESTNMISGNVQQTQLSQVPHHMIFDRCYVHAGPDEGGEFIRGFIWNSAATALTDSYVSGFKATGRDTQAVVGWNGPGPFKIVNNYLEAAGENVMFGGAQALIPNLVPSDIEIRLNTFNKPLSWRPGDPSYAGTQWAVKNLLEFKNGQRVLVEGNLFEHHWSGAQSGFFLMLTPGASDSGTWATASDFTFRYNWIQHVTAGFRVSGQDYLNQTSFSARVAIHDNVVEDLGAYPDTGGFVGVMAMAGNGIQDLAIEHNTVFNTSTSLILVGHVVGPLTNFAFENNIFHGGGYGIVGDGVGNGLIALDGYAPGWTFDDNVIVGPWPNEVGLTPTGSPPQFPLTDFFPNLFSDVGFVDLVNGNYHLAAASPYKNAGSDGKDPGADLDALEAAYGGAGDPPAPTPAPGATTTAISAPSVTASTATAISAPAVTYPANATITVTASASTGTPTGTVSLVVDGGAALSASLSSGRAQFTLTSPSAGTHTLSATYAAQPNLGSSGATGTLQVNPSGTGGTGGPDVDPLSFSSVTYSARESSGRATITVLRSGPTGGTVSVQYATSDGTARAGVDYVATSGTLTFAPGVTQRNFLVNLIGNQVVDGNRTVNLTLSNPGGGALLGAPTSAVLMILDDDVAGNVRFERSSYNIKGGTGTATITVTRSGGSAGGVTVNYTTSDGTAGAGVDYVATSGTLGFAPGVNRQHFTIKLIKNGGGNRTVTLTLSNPDGGAGLGSPSTAVLTIQPN